ncbi:MAG TPA: hypothetical protein VLU46_14090 [Thermoanaerobaculia bacterium]|nr:hypothetical protein [Thermoanaerobaculia bacterium]
MREIIIPFVPRVTGEDGTRYRVRVLGHQRADGIWEGQLEYSHDGLRLLTGVETTQFTNEALEQWATTLDPIYVLRALSRARRPGSRRGLLQVQPNEHRV